MNKFVLSISKRAFVMLLVFLLVMSVDALETVPQEYEPSNKGSSGRAVELPELDS